MTLFLLFIGILLLAHGLGAIQATNVIAARIAEENPPEGIFVPVPGGRLHLIDLGASHGGEKLPVLLLHGATSNARDIVYGIGEDLARQRRVIAVDRPGHGWSGRPNGRGDATTAAQAKLVMAALDGHGIDRFIVVGHSLAGSLATLLAVEHRDRVAGLVVLAGATHPWPGGIAWYYRLAALPVLGRLFVHTVMTPVGSWSLKKSVEDSFRPGEAPADYVRKASAALVLRPDEFRWNGQDVATLKACLTSQSPRYHEITAATAIVADPADHVVSTSIHAETLHRQVQGSRLVLVPGAGHQIHYTARQVVLEEINRLAQVADDRGSARQAAQ
ncbi:alpha/beta fold hydrolase [Labrys neptuniae]